MTLARRRRLAWSVLALCAAAGAAWLLRLDYARKISTDVLDLIPVNERDPELAMVRALASQAEARTMMFALTQRDGRPASLEAARLFARALGHAPEFTQALALADPTWRDGIGQALFEQRFPLLFPIWLREHPAVASGDGGAIEAAAREAAVRLKTFVASPEGLAFQDLVPADPLLLLPDAINRLKGGLALVQPDSSTTANTGLVWAQLAASPLSEAGQAPAFAAIARATEAMRATFPDVQVSFTGVNRFAAASRARIEREVSWLNLLSLAAVLAVAAIFIRGVHRALHLVPVIAFAVLGAWVATTMVFARVHVVVFVLGALLTGVAIDYGFYLYMQPPARPDEDYGEKVRRLLKPLLASCFTTVVGFALLLVSELPLIRQLGVFVGTGLLCALGAALLYFATVRNPFLPAREFRGRALAPATRRRLRWLLIAGWLAAVAGLTRLTWRDDIRELEIPSADLKREDAQIRAQFGDGGERTVYLTHGPTLDAARAAVDKLDAWLGRRGEHGNLATIIPTAADFEAAVRFARHDAAFRRAFSAALEREGFTPDAFAPFFDAFEKFAQPGAGDLGAAVQRMQSALVGPPSLLLHTGREMAWFVTIASGAPTEPPSAETHTVTASQLQSLNRLFANYRQSALHLSLIGLAIVGLGVLLTYGVRDGVRIFAIPCGACLGIFGLFGWLGFPLNLFHLLGAFLGVCLTHNYSIFSATSAFRGEPPPVSVRLSALTTAASFGVLALSGIPVVRALGTTVASMVIAALVVIELEHLAPLAKTR
jgi:predicted exporter